MNSPLRLLSPLLALALLSGCSSNFFGGRHAPVEQGPMVEGHPLILPPDYALRPPRQAVDYETSLPKEHFGARTVARGQQTLADAAVITSASMVVVSESTTATAPSIPGTVNSPLSQAPQDAPLSTTPAGLDANVGGALAASSVSSSNEMQAAIARDTAQEKADNQGFFHKYFGWIVPSHGKK